MIKQFLIKAGRKLKRLAGSGAKKKQESSRSELDALQKTEQHAQSPGKESGKGPDKAGGLQGGKRRGDQTRPPRKPRPKKPRWNLEQFPVDPVEGKIRFHDFSLPLGLMHAIADLDFKYCTPIQEKALPDAMAGKDIIGRAGTGTGKSAVFLIAVFARLLSENRQARQSGEKMPRRKPGCPRALIIAPTRELVMQIAKDGNALGKYTPLRIMAVYGGTDYQKQEQKLGERPIDVMVATPGRLLDYASKSIIDLRQTQIMVIDEADRMLDMGFIPDVRRIIYKTPPKEQRQTMLFSATLTEEVKHLASQWCVKPISIESAPEQVAVDTVRQVVYTVTSDEKYSVLYNLIKNQDHERIMVFTNMKTEAARLNDRLRRNGINAILLTGDVPQKKRMSRLENFRGSEHGVMIATDVAGRGIHIDGISHVVNYALPYEPEDYVHRIGRTGRAGESGIAISFACEEGAFQLPDIEEYVGKSLSCTLPKEELLVKPPKGSEKSPGHGDRRKPRPRRR
ncbi:MAG: DEAD/DEAH box helicase [Candidatus Electrothrix aestuarii]|uniref:DEAD/DEAH box helicase n=1 Tax=Candidatus Electrothrix aestuarii TaxID=3062594 RepID=A0AAU8LUF3_9BACT|nr:DEAD/DEAH box helicase [Candidatus Electrothrix aestuarii]